MDELTIEICDRDTIGGLVDILIKNGYTVVGSRKNLNKPKTIKE